MDKRVPNEFPCLPSPVRVAIVGEAPGEEEENSGKPFVGPAGHLLNSVLSRVGIARHSCFIGNVYQWRPPGNKIKAINHASSEWAQSTATLKSELAAFDPHVIVPLGETSLNELTGKSGITNWRGSPLTASTGHKAVPTFHPAFILRNYALIPFLEFDLAKALRLATSAPSTPSRKFFINPSPQQALSYINDVLMKADRVSVDFETLRGGACPLCLGFAPSAVEAICIPFGQYDPHLELEVWRAIQQLMESPVKKIFHNALFDLSVFAVWMHIFPKNVWMDTMLAFHACYPEFRNRLSVVCSIYTDQPYYKHMHKESEEEDDEKSWSPKVGNEKLWEYNCMDCCVTYEVVDPILKDMKELGAEAGFHTDMSLVPLALYMTLKGINIDEVEMKAGLDKVLAEGDKVQGFIKAAFGREVNTKSPKQLKALLYDELKLPKQYSGHGDSRKLSTDVDALLALAQKGYSNVKLLLKNRQLRTKEAFFFRERDGSLRVNEKSGMPIMSPAGRVHSGFKIAGAKTGRWSSATSILGGRNIMNIPEECRGHFIADPGKVLVGWDKAQAEARVVAFKSWLCTGDDSYKVLVESGKKVHVWFGRHLAEIKVFKCSPDDVKSGTTEYFIAKQSIHAFSYGEGPGKFCTQIAKETDGEVSVSMGTAKTVRAALYEALSSIPKWQQAIQSHLETSKIMTTAFGRIGIFWERWGDELFRKYYAFEPQSTVGDDVARSIKDIFEALPELELLQQNYDSMLAQCDEKVAKEMLARMKPLAEQPIHLRSLDGQRSFDLVVPVVMKVGKNWRDMEELK